MLWWIGNLVLLLVVDYRVAYTIAFIAGLVGGYLAHARFVFGARPGARSAANSGRRKPPATIQHA